MTTLKMPTQIQAAHLLYALGYRQPTHPALKAGSFTVALIEAIKLADFENLNLLRQVFPAYVLGFELYRDLADMGLATLDLLARGDEFAGQDIDEVISVMEAMIYGKSGGTTP